ncbi:MAG: hypothetical protein ACRDWY_18285 [Actinomycetes bacterium]
MLSLLTGCGSQITTEVNGAVAATLDPSGSMLLVLKVCSGAVDEVGLYGARQGPETQPQEPIGIWRASAPVRHDTVLHIESPGPGWEVRRDPGPLNPGTQYIVIANHREADETLSQVHFTPRQLEELGAGQLRFQGRVGNETEFARHACRAWS